jgi:hypothetical protein
MMGGVLISGPAVLAELEDVAVPIILGVAAIALIVGVVVVPLVRRTRRRPVKGLVAFLVRPDGAVYDDLGEPVSLIEAPGGGERKFAFVLEDDGYAKTLKPSSPEMQGSITVERMKKGNLLITSSGVPMGIGLREVYPILASDHGVVVAEGSGEVGSFPGWQRRFTLSPGQFGDPPA